MAKLYWVECDRCDGKGKVWATHVMNGTCFKCAGTGRIQVRTNPEARAKAKKKREEKRQAERAALEERIREGNARLEALVEKYKGDPRVNADTRRLFDEGFPARMYEVAKVLDKVDRGEIKDWREWWG